MKRSFCGAAQENISWVIHNALQQSAQEYACCIAVVLYSLVIVGT